MNGIPEPETARNEFALRNYDSAKLKRDVAPHITRLSQEGLDPRSENTLAEALECLARKHGITGKDLSVLAHVHDWQKQAVRSFDALVRKWMQQPAQTQLDLGLTEPVKLPLELLVADEPVPLGDERLTLAVALEQLQRAIGMSDKTREAFREHIRKEDEYADELQGQLVAYRELIAKATQLHGVGPERIFYNREKKAWQAVPSA